VINRMGFNNDGAEAIAARFAKQPGPGRRRIPVGINLGKSKVTPIEEATGDYLTSFGRLADYADYVVLNVSSPNTPNLRQLQDESRLRELLGAVTAANRERATGGRRRVPVLLKIAPDLTWPQIDVVLRVWPRRHHCHQYHAGATGVLCVRQRGGRTERRTIARPLDVHHQLHCA
jgi:dihydroorotate dehydrogenase